MKRVAFAVLLLGLGALPASGQSNCQPLPAPNPNPQPGGQVGCSVGVRGGLMALGANLDGAGSVIPCDQGDDGKWTCGSKLKPDDQTKGEFGKAVALDDTWLAVGAPGANGPRAGNSGLVYVYRRVDGAWAPSQKLSASDAAPGDGFGATLALSGDTLLVGAPNVVGNAGSLSGAVYIFHRNGDTWTQGQKLTADDARAFDSFGFSLAIDSNTVVIGAPFHDGVGGNSGAAYVFEWNGNTWGQTARLTASDAAAGDEFGSAVAVQGDTLAVGARRHDVNGMIDAGSVYVYERQETGWKNMDPLPGAAAGDLFGTAVSMSGGKLLIGAMLHNGSGSESGAAYLYQRSAAGPWIQDGDPILGAAAGDRLGQAVAVDGSTRLAGAYLADFGAKDAGSAKVCGSPPPHPPMADLALVKSGPASAKRGDTITYALTVTNHGPDTATGIGLEDMIPAGLQPASPLPDGCMTADKKVICTLPDLSSGQKRTVHLGFTVLAACGGTVVNTATVRAASPADPVSGNDSARVATAIATDLSITKKADRDIAEPGQALRYTIRVENPDGCRATVKDVFPAALRNAKWCREEGGPCSPSTPGSLSDLVTGPATYDVQGTVAPDFTGTLVNTATVEGSPGVLDSDLRNNSAAYPTEIFRDIPTLTEPWLATLALLLALLALRRLRRRAL
jgi:uncharacterized repeat protein (TIGR01451 family)